MAIQMQRVGDFFQNDLNFRRGDVIEIRRWNVDGQEISLFQVEDRLEYQIYDPLTDRMLRVALDHEEQEIEERANILKSCEIVVNFDGSIEFCKPHKRVVTVDNKEITLLDGSGDLIWQLFDKATGRSTQVLCWEKEGQTLNERITYLQSCRICSYEVDGDKLKSISLIEPKETASLLDNSKTISSGQSTVTLITCGESDLIKPGTWGGHAAILVEKLDNGLYRMIRVDLVAGSQFGKALLGKVNYFSLDVYYKGKELWYRFNRDDETVHRKLFTRKAATSLRPSADVNLWLRSIEQESMALVPCFFNPRGSEAFGVAPKVFVKGLGVVEMPKEKLRDMAGRVQEVVSDFSKAGQFGPKFSFSLRDPHSLPNFLIGIREKRFIKWCSDLIREHGRDNVFLVESENCISWAKRKLSILQINVPEALFSELLSQTFGRVCTLPIEYTKK